MADLDLSSITGFDWDQGNNEKNWLKHKVQRPEIEEIFFNKPLLLLEDTAHSSLTEIRWKILGQANSGRHLLVVFTIRDNKIRPISARDMSRKERGYYEEST